MDKNYNLPTVVWLKMTDYTVNWIQYEYGGNLKIRDCQVVSLHHLPAARKILMMETVYESRKNVVIGLSISAAVKNCIDSGMDIDPETVGEMYGLTKDELKLFVPIECPSMCTSINGVLRRWTHDVNFSQKQAAALQKVLRDAFWDAVIRYDREYSKRMGGKKYPAVDMIESFCKETSTPDIYTDAIRREYHRRCRRNKDGND